MASLWKRERSKYWTACFTDANGQRLKRSTKETDRRKAQRIADEFEKAAGKARTARQVRKVIAELHQDITGEGLPTLTVRQHVERWVGRKKNETKPATLAFYKGATAKLLRFLDDNADRDLTEITRDTITAFRDHEASRVSAKTANHALKCVRMVFKDAMRDNLIAEDPTQFVDVVKGGDKVIRKPFTLAQLRTILDAANDEWKSLVTFGLYTGQRLADLASLTWENIDLQANEIRFVTRKTGRVQVVVMAHPLREHIEALPAGDDPAQPLHPRAFQTVSEQGKSGTLSVQFGELLASVGLREKKTHKATGVGRSGRRESNALSFHSLRRTATTLLHEAGVPAAVAQQLIGHDSEEIHSVYVSIGREALAEAAAKLPVI